MKKSLFILLWVLATINCVAQYGYYSDSIFISLTPFETTSYFAITSEENLDETTKIIISENLESTPPQKIEDNYYILDKIYKNYVSSDYNSDIYITTNGYLAIILPEIKIEVNTEEDLDKVLKLYTNLSVSEKKRNFFTLKCNSSDSKEVLDLVLNINKLSYVKCCYPNMLSEIRLFSNEDNPMFRDQYYLYNNIANGGLESFSINAEKAWELVSVSPDIIVSVLDDGVDRAHEDLEDVTMLGMTVGIYNCYGEPYHYDATDPKGHGTACAGIIAGIDNNIGIKGVASGVKIYPVNIATQYSTIINGKLKIGWAYPYRIEEGIEMSIYNGADIICCHWGMEEHQEIRRALNHAISSGRNGKGCVVVAGSGNDYPNTLNAAFPANIDGVICVGAIDRYGLICNYSQRGNCMDLVAPGGYGDTFNGITTIDRMGIYGFGNYNYTWTFNGTSAAGAQVAGVAALILSANPNLTSEQVGSILKSSATDLGAPGYDQTFGYGLLNASKAVAWTFVNNTVFRGPLYFNSSNANFSIDNLPAGFNVQWYLTNSFGPEIPSLQTSYNTCTLSNISSTYMGVINADVYFQNSLIKSFSRKIIMYGNFYGILDNGQTFSPSNPIWMSPGSSVTLTSANLVEKIITFASSATQPSSYFYSREGGEVTILFPTGNYVSPIVMYINPDTRTMSDNSYQILLMPTSVLHAPSMSIVDVCDDSFTVLLQHEEIRLPEDIILSNEASNIINGSNHPNEWSIDVVNASSGETMFTKLISSNNCKISTSGWKTGVYIIRANNGTETIEEKIIR